MRLSTIRRLLTSVTVLTVAASLLTPTGAAASTIAGYATEVHQAAVAAKIRGTGLDEAAAVKALRAQRTSVATLRQATTTLAGTAEGGYLDQHGVPVVNVLDSAAAARARGGGVEARVVRHSAAALADAKRALEAVPAVAHTAIGVDHRTNQVVLTVTDAATGAEPLLAAAAALGDRVRVQRAGGALHRAVYNGEAITGGGSRCSAGFNTNKDGQNYVVDAGHCTGAVAEWNIGPSVGASFPGDDYGLIRNDTGHAPGAVTLWNGSTQPITEAADATVGQDICKSGSTTNLTCGTVQAVDVTVNYQEGSVYGLVQTTAAVDRGDSGGCLFAGSTGLGITSGMGGGSSFFQPVTEALGAYGVQLN